MAPRKEDWKVRFYRFALGSHPDDCWLWIGGNTAEKAPYGLFSLNGKNVLAHRLAWEIHHGPMPAGLIACHLCDNTLCINHNHIFPGTHADNSNDREVRKRGNRNGRKAALTPEQVAEIRTNKEGTRALSIKFNTTRDTIQRVREGKTYNGNPGKFSRKLTPDQVRHIRQCHASGESYRSLARRYDLHASNIKSIITRRTWKHVE